MKAACLAVVSHPLSHNSRRRQVLDCSSSKLTNGKLDGHFVTISLISKFESRSATACTAFKGFGKAATAKPRESKGCPCGSGLSYEKCCKAFHDGALPDTAEALMRSRYSAYAKGLVEYIVSTTHPENPMKPEDPDSQLEADVRATCDKIGWERLKVLSCDEGAHQDEAWVTFQTWFKVRRQIGQRTKGWHTQTFTEKSRFLRENGRWLYVDGEQNWEPT